jgi:hypothetical protein
MNRIKSSSELNQGGPVPDIIAIAGTGAPREAYPLYAPMLNSGQPSAIPARHRFLPLPGLGYWHPEKTLDHLLEQVDHLSADMDVPPTIVGHSQGGFYANHLGLDGRASAVMSLAGVNSAMDEHNLTAMFFKSLGKDKMIDYFKIGSEPMEQYREDMAERWPDGVPLHVVAPTVDQVVYHKYQFGMKLPHDSRELHEWHDVPGNKIAQYALRWAMQIPENVKPLVSVMPSEHVFVPESTGVWWLLGSMQRKVQNSPGVGRVA